MSVSGLCEICQTPDVDYTCDRCGQLVCDEHFDENVGFCVECAAEIADPTEPIQGQDPDHEDVDTYQL